MRQTRAEPNTIFSLGETQSLLHHREHGDKEIYLGETLLWGVWSSWKYGAMKMQQKGKNNKSYRY